eukprot:TRINITY_DN3358_c0_g1_i2.p1 TRINITY_DN3358_c0_g1~~TRINITY_DN3358_c0_g1_i2.p1  ORF type:complete len:728 (-),score=147.06 TRINITY_DN3358_c0_g1_i2:12-2135(-)
MCIRDRYQRRVHGIFNKILQGMKRIWLRCAQFPSLVARSSARIRQLASQVRVCGAYQSLLFSQEEKPKGFEKFWKKGDGAKPEESQKKENKEEREDEGKIKEEEKNKHEKRANHEETQSEFTKTFRFKPQMSLPPIIILVALAFILTQSKKYGSRSTVEEKEFLELVKNKTVKHISIRKSRTLPSKARIVGRDKSHLFVACTFTTDVTKLLQEIEKAQKENGTFLNEPITVSYSEEINGMSLLTLAVPIFFLLMFRRGGLKNPFLPFLGKNMTQEAKKQMNNMNPINNIFGISKSRATEYGADNKMKVTFKDVAGNANAKQEIQEFVDFLKNPKKYSKLGAKLPKGALLTGPPGTGKTLLAKACAGEAGVPFFSSSGSEFVEMFVGVGAARVRDLFQKAKDKAPSIIFLDEIDAIGKHRAKIAYNDEREGTLNQLFVEMDGFDTNTEVIVFAATNRKDALDKALIRPGRFDRIISINLPTMAEREAICLVHLKNLILDTSITKEVVARKIAALTTGMSGADLMSVCNEGAIVAARRNKAAISMEDFYEAFDRIQVGSKAILPLTPFHKKITSFHEAGHTIAGWFLPNANPILKVSIIPRSQGALGFTATQPEEIELYTKEQLYDLMCTMYGGRAAEELYAGSITTGARDDLSRITELAMHYCGTFGMCGDMKNIAIVDTKNPMNNTCLLYTSPSPRDATLSRMPSSA